MFTIRYLLDRYGWDKCIEVFGWDPYFLKEGRATESDTQHVTEQELDQLEGRKPMICSMHADCTPLYNILIDDKIVLTTKDYNEAWDRLKAEAEWNKEGVVGERNLTLRMVL